MGHQCHLNHAPIVEALIDIQFEPVSGIELSAIADVLSGGRATAVSELFFTMFELKVGENASPQATGFADAVGKRIDLTAERVVIQIRNNGFTFSRLAPYDTWEEMVEAALVAWQSFAKELGSGKIVRIAIRYINVLDLPLPLENFEKYLASPPHIPNELQQGISAFLTRVVCPLEDDVLIITQSLEGDVNNETAVKVTLDIEVSNERPVSRLDFDGVKVVLDRLRTKKNDAFFAYLTDDALELYK